MAQVEYVKYVIFDPQNGINYEFDSADLGKALEKRNELMEINSINSALTDLHHITGVSLDEMRYEVWTPLNPDTLTPMYPE